MPTILSRFDMIFIVKDQHDEAKDEVIFTHVLSTTLLVVFNILEAG